MRAARAVALGAGVLGATADSVEFGKVSGIGVKPTTVNFKSQYGTHPIVIAGTPTMNGGEWVVPQVNQVTAQSFDFKLAVASCKEGEEVQTETVSWMALATAGVHVDADGAVFESGTTMVSSTKAVTFQSSLQNPVVLATVQTNNRKQASFLRIQTTGSSGFTITIEQDKGAQQHSTPELVGWVAFAAGEGSLGAASYAAFTQGHVSEGTVTHAEVATPSYVFGAVGLQAAGPAVLRHTKVTADALDVSVSEDACDGGSTTHAPESVGLFVIGEKATRQPTAYPSLPPTLAPKSAKVVTLSGTLTFNVDIDSLSTSELDEMKGLAIAAAQAAYPGATVVAGDPYKGSTKIDIKITFPSKGKDDDGLTQEQAQKDIAAAVQHMPVKGKLAELKKTFAGVEVTAVKVIVDESGDEGGMGMAGTGGDPFTFRFGKKTQFYLPVNKDVHLATCRNVTLYGRVMSSDVPGDRQQWFDKFRVAVNGDELVNVQMADAEPLLSAKKVTQATQEVPQGDEEDVLVENKTNHVAVEANLPLTTISVKVAGKPVLVTGRTTALAGAGSVIIARDTSKRIGQGWVEMMEVDAAGMELGITSSAAQKFLSPAARVRHMHLDLKFRNAEEMVQCSGPLPEIWGDKSLSKDAAQMLVPQ